MPTSEQIKLNIAADITNKTAIKSVSNHNIGDNMNAIVDYIDQEIEAIALTPGPPGPQGPPGTNPSASLIYLAQLYQESTNDPNPNLNVDTLQLNPGDNSQDLFRIVDFTRTGVGTYQLRITHKTGTTTTNFDKIGIVFGDNSCRIEPGYGSGAAGPYSWRQWVFKTYTPEGVVADDQLTGAFITLTLYP